MAEDKRGKKDKKKDKKEKKKGGASGGEELEDDEEGGALSVILVTIFIVLIWLAILALLVKMDVGGFGSGVVAPVIKDVPVLNKILPTNTLSGNMVDEAETMGYRSLEEAVERIKELENQLSEAQKNANATGKTMQELQEEIARLQTFENNQVEFEKIKDQFYNEVIFSDRAPDISEYRRYYEEIDPENAQNLYRQVVAIEHADEEVEEYAKTYSTMKAKDAAEIFDTMTGDLPLVAKILGAMGSEARGSILGAMDAEIAARVTEIMEPEIQETLNTNAPATRPVPATTTSSSTTSSSSEPENTNSSSSSSAQQ